MSGSHTQTYAFIKHIILVLQDENLSYISIPIKKWKVTSNKTKPYSFQWYFPGLRNRFVLLCLFGLLGHFGLKNDVTIFFFLSFFLSSWPSS